MQMAQSADCGFPVPVHNTHHHERIEEKNENNEGSVDDPTPLYTEQSRGEYDDTIEPPYGWIVVAAAFFAQVLVTGTLISFGVYQDFYIRDLYSTSPASKISLVGTLAIVSMNLLGPLAGPCVDYVGYRTGTALGAVIMAVSLLVTSFTQEVWQLYLTQGILYGVGASLVWLASLSLPSQWFKRRRGLALGLASSGGGIGGLAMSSITVTLISRIGYRWTVRVMAFVHLVILLVVAVLFRSRIESGRVRRKRIKREQAVISEHGAQTTLENAGGSLTNDRIMDFAVLRDNRFRLLFCATFLCALGYVVPFFYFPTYARLNGISASTASILLGALHGASVLGRVLAGFASDHIGCINSLFLPLLLSSINVCMIWVMAKSLPAMVIFCVCYGVFAAPFFTLISYASAHLFGIGRLASVTGLIFSSFAIGTLVGVPTAGAILDNLGHKTNYLPLQLWTGSSLAFSASVLFALKMVVGRRLFARV